ncbi:MAG: PQQ-dependent dehydrogenase, methanol/ethanol family [Gemmatimonadales bacterium]|jgi:alcohol dehydrogenase (cytochrome c)|nr:PQQ-dependent dehydrogenase, methanol/ethanol family [Gemmatimonadales bacterium]MBT3497604.1 PQQ-dependent dehydrogenase, methanol/ethanol family [Gemmatimonadales bacterium]MBT3773152.1 PQQ-dependent dehydrogenase, methanol/ethanol family [Gemmatimonadales bacterium]MBT3957003.1 PQQ-dependent dehydrogenase, methanol/ethanol family [Gemmatimonadales bacterium]MBT4436554.1 PQQ-dependent dehydrogenase, methanol/ethanol family [Gemmatimonadales bacterium]
MNSFQRAATTGVFALLALGAAVNAGAQVPYERILNAADEPENWLTYHGSYSSLRFSTLSQITTENVTDLESKWVLQNQVFGAWQSNPIVVDGIMYITERPNDVMAVDAVTGRVFWMYRHTNDEAAAVCCGANNRGVAVLDDKVFMGTLDARLIALDRTNGQPLWDIEVADVNQAYSITMAPLVVKDKVLVGVGGGEFGIRGFIAAYDADTGEEAWRFYTIPGPGEPGHETWEGDDWEHGGAPIWLTGSYDAELNLTYWGVGNPGPDWNPGQRPGDNLYSDAVIALNPDTGELDWYFQFTPNDGYDYDAVQVPLLVDMEWEGEARKLMLWANRNGYFYVLDRTDGEFLSGTPFVKVNWSSGLDENGRPIQTPQPAGAPTWPGNQGGTNWYPPSYSPRTELFYFAAWEDYASIYEPEESVYREGRMFLGGGFRVLSPTEGAPTIGIGRSTPINNWTDAVGHGSVIALDPRTGEAKWKYDQFDVSDSGMLTTETDLLFTGGREGYFHALDARTGALLWKASLGAQIVMAPITFMVDGKQYVSVISGHTLVTFGLRD